MQLSEMLMNFGKLVGKIRIWWIDVANHGDGPQHCEDGQLFDQLPGLVGGHVNDEKSKSFCAKQLSQHVAIRALIEANHVADFFVGLISINKII